MQLNYKKIKKLQLLEDPKFYFRFHKNKIRLINKFEKKKKTF